MTGKNNPYLIVSGMAHSGTTFLSKFITANTPVLNFAFECGVLLSKKSPRDFHEIHPFYDWLTYPTSSGHWGLSEELRDWVCDTDSWQEFYDRLSQSSPIMKKGQWLLDKTPNYTYKLSEILKKTPHTPIFITHKNPHLLYHSYKKRNVTLIGFLRKLDLFYSSLENAIQEEPDRVHLFSHKALCDNPNQELERALSVLKLPMPDQISNDMNWELLPPLSENYNYQKSIDEANKTLTREEAESINNLVRKRNPSFNAL